MQMYLDGRLITDDVERDEIDTLKDGCDQIIDGDFFCLSGSAVVLDICSFASDDCLLYEITQYKSGHNDIHNISHVQELNYNELELIAKHNYSDKAQAVAFIQEMIIKHSSALI